MNLPDLDLMQCWYQS